MCMLCDILIVQLFLGVVVEMINRGGFRGGSAGVPPPNGGNCVRLAVGGFAP